MGEDWWNQVHLEKIVDEANQAVERKTFENDDWQQPEDWRT